MIPPFLSTAPELRDLEHELHDVTNWFCFGRYLGLKPDELKTIEENYQNLQRRRFEMLEEWQKKVIPTWSAVTQALMGIGRRRRAIELAQKHGWLNISIMGYHSVWHFPPLYLGAPPPKLPDDILEPLHITSIPQEVIV